MPTVDPTRTPLTREQRVALDAVLPFAGAIAAAAFLSVPAELSTPVVRRHRGRTGVSLGPDLAAGANALLGVAAVRFAPGLPARLAAAQGAGAAAAVGAPQPGGGRDQ